MNDDASSELWLLASAYLDGELDTAQRARAEADPAVMSAVDDLRSLQSELRSVSPPTAQRRRVAIDAALAEFDALHEALHRDPVVRRLGAGRSAHRARTTRWLGAVAAAVVVLGALGVVASSGLGESDGDQDAALDQGATEEAALDTAAADVLAAPEARERDASSTAEATAAATEPAGAPADDAGADATASEAAATMAPSATHTADTILADGYLFSTGAPIADPAQLAAAAVQLLEQQRTGQLVNTPETSCGTGQEARPLTVLAEAVYLIDPAAGAMREVYVAVDEAARQAVALDRADCATIAAAPLP